MKPGKVKAPAPTGATSSAVKRNSASSDQWGKCGSDTTNEARLQDVEDWMRSSKWKVAKIVEGLRLLEPVSPSKASVARPPCYRVDVPINASATNTFQCIMYLPPLCLTGIIKSMRVLQTIDNSTDIIHVKLQPVYTFPTWTAPRDLCLVRSVVNTNYTNTGTARINGLCMTVAGTGAATPTAATWCAWTAHAILTAPWKKGS